GVVVMVTDGDKGVAVRGLRDADPAVHALADLDRRAARRGAVPEVAPGETTPVLLVRRVSGMTIQDVLDGQHVAGLERLEGEPHVGGEEVVTGALGVVLG